MVLIRNLWPFGCLILSLVLLNNIVFAFASKTTKVIRAVEDDADASSKSKSSTTKQTKINIDGEYSLNVRFNDGFRHAERGDYEMRNGKRIFIIRGIFHYFSLTDFFQVITAYIVDHTGYHEIHDTIDIRGGETDAECDLSRGEYCVDPKLLALLIG